MSDIEILPHYDRFPYTGYLDISYVYYFRKHKLGIQISNKDDYDNFINNKPDINYPLILNITSVDLKHMEHLPQFFEIINIENIMELSLVDVSNISILENYTFPNLIRLSVIFGPLENILSSVYTKMAKLTILEIKDCTTSDERKIKNHYYVFVRNDNNCITEIIKNITEDASLFPVSETSK